MIKRNTIFDYFTQIMVIWSVSTLSICLFCFLFGEAAYGYSSIFSLGSAGISIATLMQFLVLAVIITSLKFLFFTDILIKKMSIVIRSIMMFTCIILSVFFFAAAFQWFPVHQLKPWLMFFLCFSVCAAVSVLISVIREKNDNQKMKEALERLKEDNLV